MKGLFIIGLLLLTVIGFSQNIVLKTELQTNNPYVGEEFQVTYKLVMEGSGSISHNGLSIRMEDPSDGLILVNQGQPRSSSFGFGQGMTIGQYAVIYKAQKAKTYTLPSFSFILNGKEYTSEKKSIRVTKGVDYSNRNESRDFFVDLTFSKTSTYKGAPIICKVLLFSKVQLKDYGVGKPDFQGFKVNEIETSASGRKIRVGNQNYLMYEIANYQLLPLKVGEQKLKPITVEYVYNVGRGFFAQYQRGSVNSLPYTLEIKPFPKPIPMSFENAVGDFNISTSLDKSELEINEATTLKIKLSGTGNLEMLKDPELTFANDLEVFDPKVKKNISNNLGGSAGSITYEYVIVPRTPGVFDLPKLEFTYFDLGEEKFKTVSSKSLRLRVGGELSSSASSVSIPNQQGIEVLSEDIRFIKEETNLTSEVKGGNVVIRMLIWLSLLMIIVLVSVFMKKGFGKSKASKNSLSDIRRKVERLATIESDFLSLIQNNLIEALCQFYQIDKSDFSKEVLKSKDEEAAKRIIPIIEELEMGAYAAGMINKESLKSRVLEIINGLKK